MKKTGIGIILLLAIAGLSMLPAQSKAQTIADDLQQLALDIQKLAGLKSVLNQMYQGYELVSKGYNAVKDISEGNYNLHEAFLDGLLIVSPTVRKYVRVQEIINNQAELISEYKMAYTTFREDKQITPDEIGYMMDVYNNLISQSLSNLTMLSSVITSSQLRMSDGERLRQIDRLYSTSQEELSFLRQFNNQTANIAIGRAQATNDQQTIQKLYGIQ
jgi:hypothetical protein